MHNFKDIHIGQLIEQRAKEMATDPVRIGAFLKCTEEDIENTYRSKSLDSAVLLRWSKLLEYDFFRIYSHHLILYAPPTSGLTTSERAKKTPALPEFRKNIYTIEIIEFILEQIRSGTKTRQEVIKEYRIPKTTLYKWMIKYRKEEQD
ncbi:transposase [Chryseobacterium sp.]|uniref:transposase n=1 Tax=Chryseobacterium sp. TaxID=1871047 RepID=UPI000ED12825|nr:transposase [Chryseobacterium sp.]HCA08931.1 transposase [Chryseobacterium sp.]